MPGLPVIHSINHYKNVREKNDDGFTNVKSNAPKGLVNADFFLEHRIRLYNNVANSILFYPSINFLKIRRPYSLITTGIISIQFCLSFLGVISNRWPGTYSKVNSFNINVSGKSSKGRSGAIR